MSTIKESYKAKKLIIGLEPTARDIDKISKISLRKLSKSISKLRKEKDLKKILFIGKICCKWATKSGLLYSKELEQELLKIGRSIPFSCPNRFNKKSYLHIMTEAFQTGGHTRVCERWIEFSDKNECHSLLLTDQKTPIPKSLVKVVSKKSGRVYNLNSNPAAKINQIRKIASGFEKIILHIHSDDLVTFIAFATNDFKRPVVFFNHLDHLFWVGSAISDLVISLRSSAVKDSLACRSVQQSCLLPLPIKTPFCNKIKNKSTLREKFNLKNNSKVAITIASSEKYTPIQNYDFLEDCIELINIHKNLYILAIGPSPEEKRWRNAGNITNNRIKSFGTIPNEELSDFFTVADFAIDSYPMPSFTALLDICAQGIPCLTLLTPFGGVDSVLRSESICSSKSELFEKINKFLYCSPTNNLLTEIVNFHFKDAFLAQLNKVMQIAPPEHNICEKLAYPVIKVPQSSKFFLKIQLKKKFMRGILKIFTTKIKLSLGL